MSCYRRGKTWAYREREIRTSAGELVLDKDGRPVSISGTPGVRRWKNLPNTKWGAEEAEKLHLAEVIAAWESRGNPAALSLRQYAEVYLQRATREAGNAGSTMEDKERAYRLHVFPYIDPDRSIDSITSKDIVLLKKALLDRGDLKAKTINKVLAYLHHMLDTLRLDEVVEGYAPPTIKKLATEVKDMRFLSFEELDMFLEKAKAIDHRLWLATLVAADAGLRKSELKALRLSDLDFRAEMIHVKQSVFKGQYKPPKSGKPRSVPMTKRLRDALKEVPRIGGGFLFLNDAGQPFTQADLYRHKIAKAFEAAELGKGLGWHSLRHTFCSHLAMSGAPLIEIKDYAGHASVTTTEKYMHLAPKQHASGISRLGR